VSRWEKDDADMHEPMCLILKLVLQAVSYKNAVFVSDPVAVAQQIIELLKLEILPEDILLISSEVAATLLMSPVVSLPQEYASRIILKVRELCINPSKLKLIEIIKNSVPISKKTQLAEVY
jgi:hypothetical protein